MRIFLSVFIYLFIGGLLSGAAMNLMYEKCGKPQSRNKYNEIVLLWPALISRATVVSKEAIETIKCSGQ